jgi:integral membrane protein (TIGR01906 family)
MDNLTHWLLPVLGVLFVVSVPLCFIGNNVRWVALSPDTYWQGFEKYQAAERTGLGADQLALVAGAFIEYFQAPPGSLNPVVTQSGASRPLFNEREVAHMQDVQGLIQLVFRIGLWSGIYLLAFGGGLLALQRGQALPMIGHLALWGAALTLGVLLLVGGLSFVDFSNLFLRFHQISFQNDFWMLDPRRDYLVMLFPEGFWLDVTMRIAALTAAESLALGTAGFLLARL